MDDIDELLLGDGGLNEEELFYLDLPDVSCEELQSLSSAAASEPSTNGSSASSSTIESNLQAAVASAKIADPLPLLEDHHVVVKGKAVAPTKATEIFVNDIRAEFARRKPPFETLVESQNRFFQDKYGYLYLDGNVPFASFYVPVDKILEQKGNSNCHMLEWVEDLNDIRFNKGGKKIPHVRASEECVKDYVRKMRKPCSDAHKAKKRKISDGSSESGSSLSTPVTESVSVSTTCATSTVSSSTRESARASPTRMTVTVPSVSNKLFQLEDLDDLRIRIHDILEGWKASSTGLESVLKAGLIEQFWKDFDFYENLLERNPLEGSGSNLDSLQRYRQDAHEELLVDIVNSLGNKMVDWYNQDYLRRMSPASNTSPPSNGSSGPQGGSSGQDDDYEDRDRGESGSDNGGPRSSNMQFSFDFSGAGTFQGGNQFNGSVYGVLSDLSESRISPDEANDDLSTLPDESSLASSKLCVNVEFETSSEPLDQQKKLAMDGVLVKPPFGPFVPRRRVKADSVILPAIPETDLIPTKTSTSASPDVPMVVAEQISATRPNIFSIPIWVANGPAGLSRPPKEDMLGGGVTLVSGLPAASSHMNNNLPNQVQVYAVPDVHIDTRSVHSSITAAKCDSNSRSSSSSVVFSQSAPAEGCQIGYATSNSISSAPPQHAPNSEQLCVATPFMSRGLSTTEYLSILQGRPLEALTLRNTTPTPTQEGRRLCLPQLQDSGRKSRQNTSLASKLSGKVGKLLRKFHFRQRKTNSEKKKKDTDGTLTCTWRPPVRTEIITDLRAYKSNIGVSIVEEET